MINSENLKMALHDKAVADPSYTVTLAKGGQEGEKLMLDNCVKYF